MNLRIAYMTGQYPRATDTFIRREVAALRALGVHVETLAVRRPLADEVGGPELDAERAGTHYLVPCSPFQLAWAHLDLLARSPRRYLHSLITALIVRGPGLRSLIYQVFYFLEAGLVAQQMRRRRLAHLHNHFANSSCSVAMLAAQLGGIHLQFHHPRPGDLLRASVLAPRRQGQAGTVRLLHQPFLPQPDYDLDAPGEMAAAAHRPLRGRSGSVYAD